MVGKKELVKKLETQGHATRNENGAWEINRQAILTVRGMKKARKGASVVTQENSPATEWHKLVDTLRSENTELRGENKQLRAEITGLLKNNAKGSILSRWLRI